MTDADHRVKAKRLVDAAQAHGTERRAGAVSEKTATEAQAALDDASEPLAKSSVPFADAAREAIKATGTPLELRARLAPVAAVAPGPGPGGPIWHNWAGDQTVTPTELKQPTSLEALRGLVADAANRGLHVRCVGPGHSYSDITDTDGVLIDLTALAELTWPDGGTAYGGLLPRGDELWKDPKPDEARVRVECGAKIAHVNQALNRAGLAFGNLGGHVGQTVLGAFATSTHGSGWKLPPLSDSTLSLDLVGARGKLLRIEPANGITDPAKFEAKYGDSQTLYQRDDYFDAARVSLGCLGIAYAATLRVQPAFLLHEVRTKTKWQPLRARLSANLEGVVGACRHYQVLINPYLKKGGTDYDCVEIVRSVALPGTKTQPRPFLADFETWAAAQAYSDVLVWLINQLGPMFIENQVSSALSTQVWPQPVVDQSFRVFDNGYSTNIQPNREGVSKRIPAISGDYVVPAENSVAAIDALLELIQLNSKLDQWMLQSSPISLRWADASTASASMMTTRSLCIECPQLRGIERLEDTLETYEEALTQGSDGDRLGGRPHWGQKHTLTGRPGWVGKRYPKWGDFARVFKELNPDGTFDNAFTKRLGLSGGGA